MIIGKLMELEVTADVAVKLDLPQGVRTVFVYVVPDPRTSDMGRVVNYRVDGGNPSAEIGLGLGRYQSAVFSGTREELRKIKFIGVESGRVHKLYCQCFNIFSNVLY